MPDCGRAPSGMHVATGRCHGGRKVAAATIMVLRFHWLHPDCPCSWARPASIDDAAWLVAWDSGRAGHRGDAWRGGLTQDLLSYPGLPGDIYLNLKILPLRRYCSAS